MTLQPSITCRSVTIWPAALTTMPVPYSTLRLGGGTPACDVPVTPGNAVNAFAITTDDRDP